MLFYNYWLNFFSKFPSIFLKREKMNTALFIYSKSEKLLVIFIRSSSCYLRYFSTCTYGYIATKFTKFN